MYAGHFAAGLALKAAEPRAPTWTLLLGTGFLDVLFGIFVPLGIERATITPGVSPGFRLDFIDWSHSLLMSAVWAVLYGAYFRRKGVAVTIVAAVAVFSHFVLDIFMHPPDMSLWPNAQVHLGLGLWTLLPMGWWWIEFAFIGLCCGYYFIKARRGESFGAHAGWACAVVALLHVLNAPWLRR